MADIPRHGRTGADYGAGQEELAQQKQKYEEAMKRIRELEKHMEWGFIHQKATALSRGRSCFFDERTMN